MDKAQKLREEIKTVVNRRLNLLNGDYFDLNKEVNGFTNEIMDIINSLQEESVSVWHNVQYPYDETKPVLIVAIDHTLHLWKGKFDTDKMCNAFRLFMGTEWNKEPLSIVSKWAYIDDLLKF